MCCDVGNDKEAGLVGVGVEDTDADAFAFALAVAMLGKKKMCDIV